MKRKDVLSSANVPAAYPRTDKYSGTSDGIITTGIATIKVHTMQIYANILEKKKKYHII